MTISNWELMSETRNTYVGTNAQEYAVISKSIGCWTLYIEKVTPKGKGHYSSHNGMRLFIWLRLSRLG